MIAMLSTTSEEYTAYNDSLSKRLLSALQCKYRQDCTIIVGTKYNKVISLSDPKTNDNDSELKTEDGSLDAVTSLSCDNFELEMNESNGIRLECNRIFLCLISPVLDAMLNKSSMKEAQANSIVEMPYDSPIGFKLLLKYAYCDEIEFTHSNIFEVLQVATKYRVERLESKCIQFLTTKFDWKDALLLIIDKSGEINDIKNSNIQLIVESCCQIILNKSPQDQYKCLNSIEFLSDMPLNGIKQLVSSNFLYLQEETIWQQCLKWNFVQNLKRTAIKQANIELTKNIEAYLYKYFPSTPLSLHNKDNKDNKDNNNKTTAHVRTSNDASDEVKISTERNALDTHNIDDGIAKNAECIDKNDLIWQLIPFIRFPLMNGKFIVESILPLNILSNDEALSLLKYKFSPESINLRFNCTKRTLMNPKYLIEQPFMKLDAKSAKEYQIGESIVVFYDFTKYHIKPLIYKESSDSSANDTGNSTNSVGVINQGKNGWIGVVPRSITSRLESVNREHRMRIHWQSFSSLKSSMVLRIRNAGKYEVRCFNSGNQDGTQIGGGIHLDVINIKFDSNNEKLCNEFGMINKNQAYVGGEISVKYDFTNYNITPDGQSHPFNRLSAWVGIIPTCVLSRDAATNDANFISYFYARGSINTKKLQCPVPGEFEIRMFSSTINGIQMGRGIPIRIKPLPENTHNSNNSIDFEDSSDDDSEESSD